MTATAKQQNSQAPQAAKRYEMPPVEKGDIVLWYPESGSTDSSAAIVTSVGHENICINLCSPTCHNFLLRDGVRHVSDPTTSKEANEGGRWDYTPREKRLLELIGDLTHVSTT